MAELRELRGEEPYEEVEDEDEWVEDDATEESESV